MYIYLEATLPSNTVTVLNGDTLCVSEPRRAPELAAARL